VAWNADLANAAQGQSQYMADNQIQSHTGANGSTPQQRMTAAGVNNITSSAENAYAYASSPEEAMEAFLIDWGVPSDGHRINIQQPGVAPQNAFTEAGVGIVQTNPNNSAFGPMVITQDFASQANTQPQLVGVAYSDTSGTGFYQPGEGQGGVQIDAVNLQTGQVLSTQTWASGGYELSLPAGQYQIIASLNDGVIQTANVTITNVNVEQDFVLSTTWQGGTRESAIAAAQPQPVVAAPTPQPVVVAPTPQPVVVAPTPQPVSSQLQSSTPEWIVTLPNQPTTSAASLLASSWSAWNAS
jgi:cysteine-rich secretory family protein